MMTRLIWTIWTPMSSVPKKADKFNLSLATVLSLTWGPIPWKDCLYIETGSGYHYWDYYPSALSFRSRLYNWLEDRTPVDFIYVCPIFTNDVQRLHNMTGYLGLYSLSGETSYLKISWSHEAARFGFILFQSLCNLTGASAASLPRCLPNTVIITSYLAASRFGGKTSYRLVNRGPWQQPKQCKQCDMPHWASIHEVENHQHG